MNVALAPPFIMKKFNVKGRVITFGGHLREGVQFFCRKLGKDIKDSPRIKKKKKKNCTSFPPPPLINDSSLSKTIIYSFIISFTQPWLSRNIGVVIAWHFRYCRRSRLNKQIIEKEVTSWNCKHFEPRSSSWSVERPFGLKSSPNSTLQDLSISSPAPRLPPPQGWLSNPVIRVAQWSWSFETLAEVHLESDEFLV